MTESESTSKPAKYKQPQPQAKQQSNQKSQLGSEAKLPQAQQQGKQKQQQSSKGNQQQAKQQGNQKSQLGSEAKQPQAQQQGKQKQQQSSKGNQPQAQQQGKQKQQQSSKGKQPQAKQQGNQKSQQGANGKQTHAKHQGKHKQQQATQVNKTKKRRYKKTPFEKLYDYSKGVGIYIPKKGGQRFLDDMILTDDSVSTLRVYGGTFDAIMQRIEKDTEFFNNGEMLYEELIHKLFKKKYCSLEEKHYKGKVFYTPSEASCYEVLTCIARVKDLPVDSLFYGFVATGNFALFTPFIKPGNSVTATLVHQVMRDLLREALIKNDKTLEDEHVHLDYYILYLNTDYIEEDAYELLKQLRAKGIQVITRSKMILNHAWHKYYSQCTAESEHYRKKATETSCYDLRELLGD